MCALCRRNLLTGERFRLFQPHDARAERPVCSLCEGEAAEAGWTRRDGRLEREAGSGPGWTVRLVA
jgi:hypothetical protein